MRFPRLLLALTLMLTSLSIAFFVHATCVPSDTGTAGNDAITCDAANQPAADVQGQAGDDTIYVDSGVVTTNNVFGGNVGAVAESGNDVVVNNGTVNYLYGDSGDGTSSGNDTIVNNGTVNGGIGGDTGGGADGSGNDIIINNGSVAVDIHGDAYLGDGSGNDTITNNGTVSSVYGDAGLGNGSGNDTITNNGTVTGTVFGDDYNGTGTGNDTITNNGAVGDDINAGGGNDTVIINGNTATVDGTIYGGAGYDVLTFDLSSSDPAQLQAWAEQIAAANPAGGTITLNGHTYTWTNFEELTQIVFSVARLNYIMDPLAVYCSLNDGIDVYSVVGGQGYFSLYITAQTISNGIAQATASDSPVELDTSATASVTAMPSGELQVSDGSGFTFTFTYSAYCGALPAPGEREPVTEVEEQPTYTIINQPYSG